MERKKFESRNGVFGLVVVIAWLGLAVFLRDQLAGTAQPGPAALDEAAPGHVFASQTVTDSPADTVAR